MKGDCEHSSPWRKSPLHSSGDASRLTALFVGYICPICALLTPCQAGASPLSVQRGVSPRAARVPLSRAAMETLESTKSLHGPAGLCFPAPIRAGTEMHASTLAKALRQIYGDRCTVHGFRSSSRDWASEQTSAPHAVAEAALAHQVGSAAERSYARSVLFEKRRDLMDRCARFVTA